MCGGVSQVKNSNKSGVGVNLLVPQYGSTQCWSPPSQQTGITIFIEYDMIWIYFGVIVVITGIRNVMSYHCGGLHTTHKANIDSLNQGVK